jgi:hypothetical protein
MWDIFLSLTLKLYLDTNPLIHIFNNQISSLFISFINFENEWFSKSHTYAFILTKILTIFTNLRCLKFNPSSSFSGDILVSMLPEVPISSTLLELHVNVSHMTDCLCILDGRFDQLRILHINFKGIIPFFHKIERNVGYFYYILFV